MKKLTAIFLALCLLLPCSLAFADAAYGRLYQRIATRTGPGTHYTEPGTFLGAGDYVTVHTKVWDNTNRIWWVQVEFDWGNDRCRAYTGAWRMNVDLSDVPQERALGSVRVNADADAFAGPGIIYTLWNDTVYRGTNATLYEVENGYGHIECWNSRQGKYWRVWVPLWCLSCSGQYSSSDDTYPMYGDPDDSGSDYDDDGYNSGYWGGSPVGEMVMITTSYGNARSGPGASYSLVGCVTRGECYTVYATDVASNGVTWFKIWMNGRYCWISSGLTNVGKY